MTDTGGEAGGMGGGFWIGLHRLKLCRRFWKSFVSVNIVAPRRSGFPSGDWIMDSGAFSELSLYGRYRPGRTPEWYRQVIDRWTRSNTLRAAVAQDYMCEEFMLRKTGLSVADHQRLTIERYDALVNPPPVVPVIPVLQGYEPGEYVRHVKDYGNRLADGMWVGVGSVCKRNASPAAAKAVLEAVKAERPDLRLHGLGLKITALSDPGVRRLLWSCDSMAWSFAARRNGRDANGYPEAKAYWDRVYKILEGDG